MSKNNKLNEEDRYFLDNYTKMLACILPTFKAPDGHFYPVTFHKILRSQETPTVSVSNADALPTVDTSNESPRL